MDRTNHDRLGAPNQRKKGEKQWLGVRWLGFCTMRFVYALGMLVFGFVTQAQAGWPDNYHPIKDIVCPTYVPVWSDEFNLTWKDTTNVVHTGLNTDKWWTRYVYSGGTLDYLNNEVQRYRERGNHTIDHSTVQPAQLNSYATLHLLAKNETDGTLSSGMIRSKKTFIGGCFESMVRIPSGGGVWPAFWLNSATRSDGALTWPPEIDIMEHFRREGATTVHIAGGACLSWPCPQDSSYIAGNDARCIIPVSEQAGDGNCYVANFDPQWGIYWSGDPQNRQFHTISLLWIVTNYTTQHGYVIGYLDGQPIVERNYNWIYDDGSPAGRAHILFNLAMGDQGGDIDYDMIPEALEVNYMRVYQDPAHKVMGNDTVGVNLCPTDGSQC